MKSNNAPTQSPSSASLEVESRDVDAVSASDRSENLLSQMTLREKIGQLVQFSMGFATGPENVTVDLVDLIRRGLLGSILNATGAKQINALQKHAMEESRLGIPLLFGLDVIHGYRTIFPVPLGLSCSWDLGLIERTARAAAEEATSEGVRWTFSPMVDVSRDCRWGRIMESAGEDPYLGSKIARAYVRGYQTDDLSDPTAMLACAKHFVGYGAVESGKEYNTVDLSERALRDSHLPPFQACVEAGVGSFMSAFNTLQGVPASANKWVLTDVLRGEWGFAGFVVSDWNSIGELIAHGVALDLRRAAYKGFTAGVDMDMAANAYGAHLAELVESGDVAEALVDTAVHRILCTKHELGLFDEPFTNEDASSTAILCPSHIELAREAAEASFVLLKNEADESGPILPLPMGRKIALIGPLADSARDMLGDWSCEGKAEDVITLKQALTERLGGDLSYALGTDIESESTSGFEEAVNAACKADLVILALGERHSMTGESHSRSRIGLPGNQLDLLKAVVASGAKVVLIVFSGRPLALPWEEANVPAILQAWFPGIQAGCALSRMLYGECAPQGRLTASFPRSVGQLPLYYNMLNTGRPAPTDAANQNSTAGYLDERTSPLFPFGWGLSYTTFDYSQTTIDALEVSAGDLATGGVVLEVSSTVTNTGARPGWELVQLYIRERGTSVARPVRELKGFERVWLAPGESKSVCFHLSGTELAFWTIDRVFTVEPCELTVWIAPNSQGGNSATILIGV